MKPMGDRVLLESKPPRPWNALHYGDESANGAVINGCDSLPILQQALQAARRFQPRSASEVFDRRRFWRRQQRPQRPERLMNGTKTSHTSMAPLQPQWLG